MVADGPTRRSLGLAAGAGGLALALPTTALASHAMGPRPAPPGFLWGTAISAHQSEGNNTNSDTWLLENLEPTVYAERSGDACDSYHRFRDDIALNAALEQMPTGMTRPGIHTGPRV